MARRSPLYSAGKRIPLICKELAHPSLFPFASEGRQMVGKGRGFLVNPRQMGCILLKYNIVRRTPEMEAAGIEPASENVPQESLHTCQVPVLSRAPGLKEPASEPEHQPVEFRPALPGQPCGAILHKVTPFNWPTGELVKDVSWC